MYDVLRLKSSAAAAGFITEKPAKHITYTNRDDIVLSELHQLSLRCGVSCIESDRVDAIFVFGTLTKTKNGSSTFNIIFTWRLSLVPLFLMLFARNRKSQRRSV